MHPLLKFLVVVVIASGLMLGCGCTDGRVENASDTVKASR